MSFTEEKIDRIYQKTEGRCHICRKQLCFSNYGATGKRGAWEVEHSKPKSKGGSDHLNNLYAACISCNRKKGNSSTATARAANGYRRAPLSEAKRGKNAVAGGAIGALSFLLVPPHLRLAAAVVGGIVGAAVGNSYEPE
jgi:5-methylcytosine-specific restriction endonuclease McrA